MSEDLKIRLKAEEMTQYGYAALRQFPKAERFVMSADIRQSMYEIIRLIVITNKRYHKKATLQDLDAECWLADNLELETNEKTSVFPIAYKYGRGLDFLGYHLWPSGRRLRKTSLKRLKRRIRRLHKKYIAGLIGLAEAKEKLNSMIAHAKHGNAHQAISKALDQTAFRGLIA